MKKKVLGVVIASAFILGGLVVNSASAEGENGGIPAQIEELKVVLNDLTKQVTDLLPLKEEVKSVNEDVTLIKGTVSNQQESIDSINKEVNEIGKEIEGIKNESVTTTSDGQKVQQRLSFEGANWTVVVTLKDTHHEYYLNQMPVPDRVVYLWEENKPEDKLVGVTDYKGNIVFNVTRGKKYIAQFKGDDKYKPNYDNATVNTSSYAKNDTALIQTFAY